MVIAEERDSAGAKPLHGKREISKARVACQGLTQQAYGSGIDRVARAAVGFAADGIPQPATGAELSKQLPACMIRSSRRRFRPLRVLQVALGPLFLFGRALPLAPL